VSWSYWPAPVVPPAVVLSEPVVVAPEVVAPVGLAVLVEPVVGPFTVPPTFVADESDPSVLLGVDVCTSLLPHASRNKLLDSRAASAK
jgi:hypothetical protein